MNHKYNNVSNALLYILMWTIVVCMSRCYYDTLPISTWNDMNIIIVAVDAFTTTTRTKRAVVPTKKQHLLVQQLWKQYSRRNSLLYSASSSSSESTSTATDVPSSTKKKSQQELDTEMSQYLSILNDAAQTKQVDSDLVYNSLVQLEQCARQYNKLGDPIPTYSYGQRIVDNISGSWQLVFTTGTKQTQDRMNGGKINYFPLKAIQTFNTTTNVITNAIYIGNFIVLQFSGSFTFDIRKCQLQFDFSSIQLLQTFTIALQTGQAAEMGAATGLGSESNIKNIKNNKKQAFFNWISADNTIATARGGGGGLALWKRV